MNTHEIEDRYTLPTYAKLPFALVRGSGCRVEDDQGRSYLDLYGGHAVSILGHSHPRWVAALRDQLGRLDFYSNVCYSPERAEASERLVCNSYPSMRGVFFCNSGAEANETAIKLARKVTGRARIIAAHAGFHGRTIGALSVTGNPRLRDMFPQNLAGLTDFVDFGDLDAIGALDLADTAAVIVEPIQSLSGVFVATPEYYRGLRELCSGHGVTLIFDEVQTGSGRTGKWFAGHHWDVEPDLVTTAKGVGGGFPVGAVIANERIAADVKVGDHGSTFGGGPMAAAAVAATLRTIEEDGLVARVARCGADVRRRLEERVGRGLVREVRGLGYLLGIECERPARDVQSGLREAGILVGGSGEPNTFRLLPPLTVSDAEWDEFFAALDSL